MKTRWNTIKNWVKDSIKRNDMIVKLSSLCCWVIFCSFFFSPFIFNDYSIKIHSRKLNWKKNYSQRAKLFVSETKWEIQTEEVRYFKWVLILMLSECKKSGLGGSLVFGFEKLFEIIEFYLEFLNQEVVK